MADKRILIINQHGENRGDEAAMRAMVRNLNIELGGNVEFDIIVQFRDTSLTISFAENVHFHHMIMPVFDALRLALYAAVKAIGIESRFLLKDKTKKIIDGFKESNLVISAPGGPYFGDIYSGHEPVHWFYVWLAKIHGKPLFLYAPSAGPFRKPIYNWFRRRIYKMFNLMCTRESRSLNNLKGLLGDNTEIHLTADSAIQEVIEPYKRNKYFTGERSYLADKFIVAVTGMQYRYPGESDPVRQQAYFTEVFLGCLNHIIKRKDCHLIFLPQLCGKSHNDTAYHELLGKRLPAGTSCEIVPSNFISDQHRKVFGMADFCLASRYHPQIFATINGVPGVFPCYEHKQFAYLEAMGIKEFAFDIRSLKLDELCTKIDEVLDQREELSKLLIKNSSLLREKSHESTRLVVELFNQHIARKSQH